MKFKKWSILFILPLFLSACDLSLSKEDLTPGVGMDVFNIEFYQGDNINTDGHEFFTLEPLAADESSFADGHIFASNTEIMSAFNNHEQLVSIGEEFKNVSQSENGIQIGNFSHNLFGEMTINLDSNVTMVEIYAKPRAKEIAVETGYEIQVDQNVAISINESKYIRLDCVNYEEDTICKYQLPEDGTNSISLSVFGERAIVSKIVLYI